MRETSEAIGVEFSFFCVFDIIMLPIFDKDAGESPLPAELFFKGPRPPVRDPRDLSPGIPPLPGLPI